MSQTAKEGAEGEPVTEDKLISRIHGTMDRIDRIVGDKNVVSQAFATAPQPAAPWHVWVCVGGAWLATTAALLALQAAWNSNQRMTDLRTDMQAERLSREQMDNWTAQEVTAIRSYITNGKLVPMQPRPTPKKEAKNVP